MEKSTAANGEKAPETVPELLQYFKHAIEIYSEQEYQFFIKAKFKKSAEACRLANMYGKLFKTLSDAWDDSQQDSHKNAPRNCDMYRGKDAEKTFLRDIWLVDSGENEDPIENWTEEMLLAYIKWLLDPCKKENQ